MAGIEIDPEKLSPGARAALNVALREEITRLETEQALAEERGRIWDEQMADAEIQREDRERRQKAQTVADIARKRINGASANVLSHLERSKQPGIAQEVKSAEERLALASFERIDQWAAIEKRYSAQAKVVEPPVYHRGSTASWFADLAALSNPASKNYRAARERMDRYGRDLANDRFGEEGWRARRIWRDVTRRDYELRDRSEAEYRAMSSNATSGGSFVPPAYAVEDFAKFRTFPATFWRQACTSKQLPSYGLQLEVPAITGGADAGSATENTAQTEQDPQASYSQQPIGSWTSLVNASQQLYDRAGPVGFDSILYAQLAGQLESQIDSAVIALALAGANIVTRTLTTGLQLQHFLSDIGQAAKALQTTNGTALTAINITAASGIAEWLMAQVTSNGYPWFQPSLGGRRMNDGQTGQGVSGLSLLEDDNIAASGGNAQLLVSNPEAIFVYSGEPLLAVSPEGGLAGGLTVTFTGRQYAAPIARYPKGVTLISGSGYSASPSFA